MQTYIKTPLLRSTALSKQTGKNIFLKMELMQPSGSFKDRGMTVFCRTMAKRGYQQFISSSGGNAGLAVASVGRALGLPVTVVVPKTTTQLMINRIKNENAEVIVHGANWNEADARVQDMIKSNSNAAYVHPFKDELLWEGHSTIVDELVEQLEGCAPDAILCSVGGGGLLNGVCLGLDKHGWTETTIIPCETIGADSFYQAFHAKKVVELPAITSCATSLGAKAVHPATLEFTSRRHCVPHRVSDSDCLAAVRDFLESHRALVEPACAASLAALQDEDLLRDFENIVVVVCGGSGINLEILEKYEKLTQAKL